MECRTFNLFDTPNLEKRVVCISDDYILSSQVSSCFNEEHTYFVVLEPPRSFHKFWRNEFIKLNNVLAQIRADRIIFVNVELKMVRLIKSQLNINETRYEYLKDQADVLKYAGNFKDKFKGVIKCPPDSKKITYALLEAKKNKFQLIVDAKTSYKFRFNKNTEKHLIVSNSSSKILPVLLANYAFAISADIGFFSTSLKYTPQEIYSIIKDSKGLNKRAVNAKKITSRIKSRLELNLKKIDKYNFVTFFTDDFEYGYFFREIPNTHIFNKLLPSYFLASSIAQPKIEIQSALLVDTGFFEDSETYGILNFLAEKEVVIKELEGDRFSNSELDNCIQFLPYDFLFICSHAGFPKGSQFKIKFKDKNSVEHIIIVNILDSFELTNKGVGKNRIVNVKTFIEFVELDGHPWYRKKYKKNSSKTILEDFIKIDRKEWDVLHEKEVNMEYSNVIATKDPLGYYIPMLHSISNPESTPFIFNNACLTNYTMAINFIFAGSNFYIGTVKPVGSDNATKIAISFFEKTIVQFKPLALSLWEAMREVDPRRQDAVYTCAGCHFQRFVFNCFSYNKSKLVKRLQDDIIRRNRKAADLRLEKNVRERHGDAAQFLQAELINLVE